MTLGERIKELRTNAGLSQEKTAELVGVSRQAVTKWEADQSAPSTENLFKLAGIFGTTVDMVLSPVENENNSLAEQIYKLYKTDLEKKDAERRAARKKNILLALAVFGGYVIIYFATRIFADNPDHVSGLTWLIGTKHLPYLIGWLIDSKMFWISMAISIIPSLFGKKYFSFSTLFGFSAGLLLGELCGRNPAGAEYGHGHYGWAIWICIYLFSIAMGTVFEKLFKSGISLKDKRLWIWCAVFVIGIISVVLMINTGMPTDFS